MLFIGGSFIGWSSAASIGITKSVIDSIPETGE